MSESLNWLGEGGKPSFFEKNRASVLVSLDLRRRESWVTKWGVYVLEFNPSAADAAGESNFRSA